MSWTRRDRRPWRGRHRTGANCFRSWPATRPRCTWIRAARTWAGRSSAATWHWRQTRAMRRLISDEHLLLLSMSTTWRRALTHYSQRAKQTSESSCSWTQEVLQGKICRNFSIGSGRLCWGPSCASGRCLRRRSCPTGTSRSDLGRLLSACAAPPRRGAISWTCPTPCCLWRCMPRTRRRSAWASHTSATRAPTSLKCSRRSGRRSSTVCYGWGSAQRRFRSRSRWWSTARCTMSGRCWRAGCASCASANSGRTARRWASVGCGTARSCCGMASRSSTRVADLTCVLRRAGTSTSKTTSRLRCAGRSKNQC
mmetsp:Transcript_44535/g.127664  ORF Transcript_44535/g.127664 Transcript_44535/m.127664 type:complete len:311 (+) Transcript_44535:209-1141(+)